MFWNVFTTKCCRNNEPILNRFDVWFLLYFNPSPTSTLLVMFMEWRHFCWFKWDFFKMIKSWFNHSHDNLPHLLQCDICAKSPQKKFCCLVWFWLKLQTFFMGEKRPMIHCVSSTESPLLKKIAFTFFFSLCIVLSCILQLKSQGLQRLTCLLSQSMNSWRFWTLPHCLSSFLLLCFFLPFFLKLSILFRVAGWWILTWVSLCTSWVFFVNSL